MSNECPILTSQSLIQLLADPCLPPQPQTSLCVYKHTYTSLFMVSATIPSKKFLNGVMKQYIIIHIEQFCSSLPPFPLPLLFQLRTLSLTLLGKLEPFTPSFLFSSSLHLKSLAIIPNLRWHWPYPFHSQSLYMCPWFYSFLSSPVDKMRRCLVNHLYPLSSIFPHTLFLLYCCQMCSSLLKKLQKILPSYYTIMLHLSSLSQSNS